MVFIGRLFNVNKKCSEMFWVLLTLMVVPKSRQYREGRCPVLPQFPLFSLRSNALKLQSTSTNALVTCNHHVWWMNFEEQLITIYFSVLRCFVTGEGPKHADEEIWSSGSSSPLSFHLFFNLSGIQSQTRNGFQLFVTGAKLRLLKFVEVGETIWLTNQQATVPELGLNWELFW